MTDVRLLMTDVSLFQQTAPVCPYCKLMVEEWWSISGLTEIDANGALECPECKRSFGVSLYIRFTTGKDPDDEGEEDEPGYQVPPSLLR